MSVVFTRMLYPQINVPSNALTHLALIATVHASSTRRRVEGWEVRRKWGVRVDRDRNNRRRELEPCEFEIEDQYSASQGGEREREARQAATTRAKRKRARRTEARLLRCERRHPRAQLTVAAFSTDVWSFGGCGRCHEKSRSRRTTGLPGRYILDC